MATIEIELLPSGSSLDSWKVAGADPRNIPAPSAPERFDAARRQDLCATVRNACPNIGAVAGLRAVRTLAAMRSHPDYVQGRSDHLAIVSDGTMTPFPAVPEPFTTRQHESKPRRSRKGRSTFDLVRGHDAQVIGRLDYVTRPYDLDEGISTVDRGYLEAHLSTVPRKGYGRSGLGVLRVTDYRLSAYGVPALLGSEIPGRRHGNAWSTIIPGDRSSQCSVAVHRTDLMGGEVPSHLARFAALSGVYASDTPTSGAPRVARFPLSRLKLRKLQARRTDPSTVTFTKSDGKQGARFVPTISHDLATAERYNRDGLGYARCFVTTTRYVMPTDRLAVRWCSLGATDGHTCDHRCTIHLATIPPEHLWLGHALTPRGMTTRQAREATSARKQALTIGTVDAPSSLEAWQTLLECVNRGEAVKVTYPDGTRRTITRQAGDAGVYSSGSGKARIQARSAEAMALRLI